MPITNNFNHQLRRNIKGINLINGETHIFKSKTQASKFYGCSSALVYNICHHVRNAKTFNHLITFEYADNENPDIIIPNKGKGKSKYSNDQERMKAQYGYIKKYVKRVSGEKKIFKEWLRSFRKL